MELIGLWLLGCGVLLLAIFILAGGLWMFGLDQPTALTLSIFAFVFISLIWLLGALPVEVAKVVWAVSEFSRR